MPSKHFKYKRHIFIYPELKVPLNVINARLEGYVFLLYSILLILKYIGITMNKPHVDKYIFFICLVISIALFIGGFFCPPMGQIDGSVLTAGGILFAFAALGVAGQNIANGKDVVFKKGDAEITVGDTDETKN